MSKKLLIILIAVTLAAGGAVTLSVAYFTSSYYKAKASLSYAENATTINATLSQRSQGAEVNRIVTEYKKTESGYLVNEKKILLSVDALSEEKYSITENAYETDDIFPIVFKMRLWFFENTENQTNDGEFFNAHIKASKIRDFFSLNLDAENVKLTVEFKDKKVVSYAIIYYVKNDEFTLTVKFAY